MTIIQFPEVDKIIMAERQEEKDAIKFYVKIANPANVEALTDSLDKNFGKEGAPVDVTLLTDQSHADGSNVIVKYNAKDRNRVDDMKAMIQGFTEAGITNADLGTMVTAFRDLRMIPPQQGGAVDREKDRRSDGGKREI